MATCDINGEELVNHFLVKVVGLASYILHMVDWFTALDQCREAFLLAYINLKSEMKKHPALLARGSLGNTFAQVVFKSTFAIVPCEGSKMIREPFLK